MKQRISVRFMIFAAMLLGVPIIQASQSTASHSILSQQQTANKTDATAGSSADETPVHFSLLSEVQ